MKDTSGWTEVRSTSVLRRKEEGLSMTLVHLMVKLIPLHSTALLWNTGTTIFHSGAIFHDRVGWHTGNTTPYSCTHHPGMSWTTSLAHSHRTERTTAGRRGCSSYMSPNMCHQAWDSRGQLSPLAPRGPTDKPIDLRHRVYGITLDYNRNFITVHFRHMYSNLTVLCLSWCA